MKQIIFTLLCIIIATKVLAKEKASSDLIIRKNITVNNVELQCEGIYDTINSCFKIQCVEKRTNQSNNYCGSFQIKMQNVNPKCWDFEFCSSTNILWIIVLQKDIRHMPVEQIIKIYPLKKENGIYNFALDSDGNICSYNLTRTLRRQLYHMFKAGITLKPSSRGTLPEYSISCSNGMAVVHGSIANTYNYDIHIKLDNEFIPKAQSFNFYERDKKNEKTDTLLKKISGYIIKEQ
jgi:hypothetical protein